MNAYSFRPCGGDFPFAAGTRIPAAAAARRIDKPAQTAKGDEQPVTLTPTVEYESLRDDKSTFYYYKKTLLISLILSFLILAPFVIVEWIKTGSPVFLYYGDYNVQQIPFYEHCVRMVHEGNFGWDWLTDLGSNFIGSYSYYLLGSPFFWLMCLFPASWAPYLMAPIYMLKFATAAVIAYAYLKRFVKNKDYAVIGALLYAFSGFQIYNIFFNQFHEVVAFFPLLLIGMEELVQNNRRGQFALAVAINCMMNYFMFAGQVAFCIMYFMFRCTKRSFRINLKNFLCLAVEAVLGVLIGSVLFLPACLAILDNPRLGGGYEGWRMLFYMHSVDGEQTLYTERYVHIIESYFFPPDIPSRVNFAYGHNERWASNAIWLPLFGMSGVFSYIAARKRSWLSYFSVFLMLCSVVPLLNSSFFLLNSSYYARWNYMMILMFCVATVIALEDRRISFKRGLIANAVACAVIAVPIGLRWYQESEGSDWELGTMPYADRFWLYVAIAFGSLIALHFITKYLRGRKTRVTVSVSETQGKRVVRCIERSVFVNGVLIAVCVATVLYAVLHVFHGKCHSWSSDFLVDQAINGEVELPEEDGFYRIDFYRKEGPSPTYSTTSACSGRSRRWKTSTPSCRRRLWNSIRPTAFPARSARAWNRSITASSRCFQSNIRSFPRRTRRSTTPSASSISTRRTGLTSTKISITSGWGSRSISLWSRAIMRKSPRANGTSCSTNTLSCPTSRPSIMRPLWSASTTPPTRRTAHLSARPR